MTMTAGHPTIEILRAFAQGRLPPGEARQIERHIESCDDCVNSLASDLIPSDPLSDLLKQPPTEVVPESTLPNLANLPQELLDHPRYAVEQKLGQGGMGTVYKATHRIMQRPVALKLIRTDLLSSPVVVERFRREVRSAAKLAHPNIVAAYDAEEIAGTHVLVMEYVAGRTLDAVVGKRGALPVPMACHFAKQIATGLGYAHGLGMIHRDIKPHNVVVTEKGKVKILDFGLACWRLDETDDREHPTKERQGLGTLLYSAPEQRASARTVDTRADQYSLGATLVAMLLGGPPLPGHRLPDTVPAEVKAIITRLMADDPDDRYPSMKAVTDALSPWCNAKTEIKDRFRYASPWVIAGTLLAIVIGIIVWTFSRPGPVLSTVPKTESQTIELLSRNAPQGVAGTWTKGPDGWRVDAVESARAIVSGTLPAEYDIRLNFTRHTGTQSVGVIIVQNGRQVCFELDAWDQHLGGFQNIDGQSLRTNPTRKNNVHIINNQSHEIFVEVRRDSIRGFLNGTLIASHRTDGRDLSIEKSIWGLPRGDCLGLIAWRSETTFHSLELIPK